MAGSGFDLLISLKSALENAETSLRREQSLENEIERKKRENDLLQEKVEIEESKRLKVEKEFRDLKESASIFRDENELLEFQSKIEISTRLKVEKEFRDLKELDSMLRKEKEIEVSERLKLQNEFGVLKESASSLREEKELLEGKLKSEISARLKVERELHGLKYSASLLRKEKHLFEGKFGFEAVQRSKLEKDFGDLKESASRLREENEQLQGKIIEVSERLSKSLKEFGDLKESTSGLQGKFEIEVSEFKKEIGDLKKSASRLREERDGLCKRLKEKVGDQKEITELKRRICELECAKLKATTDADVYQNRIKELEGEVLIMNVEKDVTTHDQTNSGKRKVRDDDFGENANPTDTSSHRKRTEFLPKDRIDVICSNSGCAPKGGKSEGDTKSSKLPVNKITRSKLPSWMMGKAPNLTNKYPKKPKKPAGPFFVFMEEFRETYKKEHPKNKSVAAVGRAGGDKWKSMSESEKAPFVTKSDERKVEHVKIMKAYNKELQETFQIPIVEEESESEVNDDDEESSTAEE